MYQKFKKYQKISKNTKSVKKEVPIVSKQQKTLKSTNNVKWNGKYKIVPKHTKNSKKNKNKINVLKNKYQKGIKRYQQFQNVPKLHKCTKKDKKVPKFSKCTKNV